MRHAGIIIDLEGNEYAFGDVNNQDFLKRKIIHESFFENEVSNNAEFKKLNLVYDEKDPFVIKASKFAAQGIITIVNVSENLVLIYSPKKITEYQKEKMLELYDMLYNFEEQAIGVYDLHNYEDFEEYSNLDEYYSKLEIGSKLKK